MNLTLKRRYKGETYTIGTLHVDGVRFCDTLEDRDRGLSNTMSSKQVASVKVKGKTAIPTGKYFVDMHTVSPRFKNRSWAKATDGIVPRIVDVPGFAGVLIHPGNTADDTEGCILVGENKVKGKVTNSVATYLRLFAMMAAAAKAGDTITIEIR